MSFADELNSKVSEYNNRKEDAPDIRGFIDSKVAQYTKDIKTACTEQAEKGQRRTRGFFCPSRGYYDEGYTSYTKPKIIDENKKLIYKKPSISSGPYSQVKSAGSLFDAVLNRKDFETSKGIVVDDAIIEKVCVGVIRALSGEGFKKLEIEHLTGPDYKMTNGVFGTHYANKGTCHYFYVDIEW